MTLDDLTVSFAHLNRDIMLSDWEWLIGKSKLPVLITAGGDAFVKDTNDDTVHFLDVTMGYLTKVAATGKEFRELLDDREFVGTHFSVQMVGELMRSGLNLPKGKIYSFVVPPAMGGAQALSNVEISNIEVHFSIAGQTHNQIKDLPIGTPIDSVKLVGPSKPKKWWQLWS